MRKEKPLWQCRVPGPQLSHWLVFPSPNVFAWVGRGPFSSHHWALSPVRSNIQFLDRSCWRHAGHLGPNTWSIFRQPPLPYFPSPRKLHTEFSLLHDDFFVFFWWGRWVCVYVYLSEDGGREGSESVMIVNSCGLKPRFWSKGHFLRL